jgi:hypothetical protein
MKHTKHLYHTCDTTAITRTHRVWVVHFLQHVQLSAEISQRHRPSLLEHLDRYQRAVPQRLVHHTELALPYADAGKQA